MAVTEYNLLADGTFGPMYGADGSRTYQQTWDAITDTEETWRTVANAIGIVQFETSHYADSFALATEADFKQDEDDHLYWRVVYKFSTRLDQLAQIPLAGGGGGGGSSSPTHDPDDPLSWAAKVRWSTKMFKRVRFRDNDGVLMANRAFELYEAAQKEYPRLVMNVRRNVADFDVSLLNSVVGSVNNSSLIGYAARRIKCERLTAEFHRDKQRYWELDGEFIIGADIDINTTVWPDIPQDGWWFDKRLNAGYSRRELNNGVIRTVPIYERGGQRPARPKPLSADGFDILNLSVTADLDALNFRYFRELDDADFEATGIFDP